MRRPIGLVSAWVGAAFLLLGPATSRADGPKPEKSPEVLMKSLDTNLIVNGRVVNTRGRFLRYRVENVQGDWLWLVSDQGTRGWANRRDVIPVDQAVSYFSQAIAHASIGGGLPAAQPGPLFW